MLKDEVVERGEAEGCANLGYHGTPSKYQIQLRVKEKVLYRTDPLGYQVKGRDAHRAEGSTSSLLWRLVLLGLRDAEISSETKIKSSNPEHLRGTTESDKAERGWEGGGEDGS